MINFIIFDDDYSVRKCIEKTILQKMLKNNLAYQTHFFEDYTAESAKIVEEKLPNKIYILDIELPSISGIDIARKIRQNDLDSILIFLTSHEDAGYTILKSALLFLTFISKFENYETKLEEAITQAIQLIGKKQYMRIVYHGVIYTIPLNDILYITKDSILRKTVIKTDYEEIKISVPLQEIQKHLDTRFYKTHRACIVNMDHVRLIDTKKKILTFYNGIKINLLSNVYKKGLPIHE